MKLTIQELYSDPQTYKDHPVFLAGFVRSVRVSRSIAFIDMADGSSFALLQITVSQESGLLDMAKKLTIGSSITASGVFQQIDDTRFELFAQELQLLQLADRDFPLQKKRHSFEYLRTIAHLRPRTNAFYAVFRIRSIVSLAIHDFFGKRGFVYVHTPIITTSDCEGAGEMFRVTTLPPDQKNLQEDFFGKPAYLTVSGQLSAETLCMAFRNVYTFGPTFRAENSNTKRHAAEFWMVEPEMAFCDLAGDMDVAQDMIRHIIRSVFEQAPQELQFLDQFVEPGLLTKLQNVLEGEFVRIPYTKAIEILKEAPNPFTYPVRWEDGLQTEHEKYLCEQVFHGPVFVTDYPKDIKAFYMRQNDDGKTVAAVDLLLPGVGEIIGGSQREERLDLLTARIQQLGMDPASYDWYLDLRRFGSVPHSGFGLGLERMVMYLTGMQNIRDVIPYPRTVHNAQY